MSRKVSSRSRSSKAAASARRAPVAKATVTAAPKPPGIRKPRSGLTAAEEAFCQHYAVNQVGSEAVRHAWPEWRTKPDQYVAQKASKLKAAGKIQERIERLAGKTADLLEKRFEITTEKVLAEIAATAFANAGDYFDWGVREMPRFNRKTGEPIVDPETGKIITEAKPYAYAKPADRLTRQQKAAIVGAEQSISKTGDVVVSVKMANKLQALALLLQHTAKKDEKPPASVQVNVVGAAQVVTDSASIAAMHDPKAALRAFEEARARLMPPKKV